MLRFFFKYLFVSVMSNQYLIVESNRILYGNRMKTEQNPFDEYWHRIFVASHNLWLTTHSRIHSSLSPCARFNFNKSDKLSVSHQVSWHDVFTNMHLLIEFKCQHKFPLSFSPATFERWRKKLCIDKQYTRGPFQHATEYVLLFE